MSNCEKAIMDLLINRAIPVTLIETRERMVKDCKSFSKPQTNESSPDLKSSRLK